MLCHNHFALLAVYRRTKERIQNKRHSKQVKEAGHIKSKVNTKSGELAQKAVQSSVAAPPRSLAVRESGDGNSSDSNISSYSRQAADAAPATPTSSPQKLNVNERLYEDAVRRMRM